MAKLDQIAAGIASGRVRSTKKKRKASKKKAAKKPAKRKAAKKPAKREARSRTESFLAKRRGPHAYHAPVEHTTDSRSLAARYQALRQQAEAVKQRSLYP